MIIIFIRVPFIREKNWNIVLIYTRLIIYTNNISNLDYLEPKPKI